MVLDDYLDQQTLAFLKAIAQLKDDSFSDLLMDYERILKEDDRKFTVIGHDEGREPFWLGSYDTRTEAVRAVDEELNGDSKASGPDSASTFKVVSPNGHITYTASQKD